MLRNLTTGDPTEHFDVADLFPDVVKQLQARLDFYRQTMVPANYPPADKGSDPKNFGGNWSPGWCQTVTTTVAACP